MDPHRTERVSEALREELGEMIAYELSDPRVSETTVTEVLVTPGMKHAQVRLHFADPKTSQAEVIAALNGAKHYLRQKLRERLTLFRIPELHFEADVHAGAPGRMEQLMKRIRRGRPRDEKPDV
jgi:ribosome-binding factor A